MSKITTTFSKYSKGKPLSRQCYHLRGLTLAFLDVSGVRRSPLLQVSRKGRGGEGPGYGWGVRPAYRNDQPFRRGSQAGKAPLKCFPCTVSEAIFALVTQGWMYSSEGEISRAFSEVSIGVVGKGVK